jgi:hypothetical protein
MPLPYWTDADGRYQPCSACYLQREPITRYLSYGSRHATTPKVNAVVTAAAVAAPKEEAPACTRMIRVVYAGYGEGQGAPCSVLVR